ncbi:hypothetical protein N9Y59_01670 [Planktomarina temperata]|nr:hypothetical protein [Planktomarina temperata]
MLVKEHIKRLSFFLSLLLLARHAQFYLFEVIDTEFGSTQTIAGIALIPVTAAFGTSFCLGRTKIIHNNKQFWRVVFIFLLPFILSVVHGFELKNIIEYTIYDGSRRPPFLILIAIALVILIYDVQNRSSKNIQYLLVAISFIVINTVELFFIYYAALMLLSSNIINKLLNTKSNNIWILIYCICTIYIAVMDFSRIHPILELFILISLIMCLLRLADLLNFSAPKFSILEFYIVQAVTFTIMQNFLLGYIGAILVCAFTFAFLFLTGRLIFDDQTNKSS